MPRSAKIRQIAAITIAASLLVGAFYALFTLYRQPPLSVVERIRASGVLQVATRRGPTAYYQGAEGPDGFEYALVRRFARYLGVETRFVFPPTLDQLLDLTARNKVHMAAAGLTVTDARRQVLQFSRPYQSVTEQLVYRRGTRRPRSLDEIADGDLHVVADSSHEESLHALRASDRPDLDWQRHPVVGMDRLLSDLDQGKIRLTIADSHELALSRRVYKHAAVALDLGAPRPIAWAFGVQPDQSLIEAANTFLERIDNDGTLKRLRARYYGHAGRLNFVDTRDFWRHVRDRLPKYQAFFEEAAQATGIDWRLLAAMGYQESHWRPKAVSPTGVRGVMMLTRSTAKQMGIKNRNDPRQSILGGAKYLRVVEKKLPQRITPPNRLWLTLAGYNIGFGHLEDARILTQRQGANPDLWLEVKQRLPLLTKKKFYKTVKRGFARGQEAVDYVDNIRNYYDLLVWYTNTSDEQTRARLLASEDSQ